MRGQAFVVFRDVAEATSAKNNLDGFNLFDKGMVKCIYYNLESKICCKEIKNFYF